MKRFIIAATAGALVLALSTVASAQVTFSFGQPGTARAGAITLGSPAYGNGYANPYGGYASPYGGYGGPFRGGYAGPYGNGYSSVGNLVNSYINRAVPPYAYSSGYNGYVGNRYANPYGGGYGNGYASPYGGAGYSNGYYQRPTPLYQGRNFGIYVNRPY